MTVSAVSVVQLVTKAASKRGDWDTHLDGRQHVCAGREGIGGSHLPLWEVFLTPPTCCLLIEPLRGQHSVSRKGTNLLC